MADEPMEFCLKMSPCKCGSGSGEGAGPLDLSYEEQYAGYKNLGKKVYVKMLDCGKLSNNSTTFKPHGIAGIYEVLRIEFLVRYNNIFTVSNYYNTSQAGLTVNADTENIRMHTNGDWSTRDLRVTIYYTCTDR